MEKITIQVEGMTCGGCVNSIQNALNGRDGVQDAVADLESGSVTVDFDPAVVQRPALEAAIEDAGFDVAA